MMQLPLTGSKTMTVDCLVPALLGAESNGLSVIALNSAPKWSDGLERGQVQLVLALNQAAGGSFQSLQ